MWGDAGRYRAACAASTPSSQTNSSSSSTPLWSLSAWLGEGRARDGARVQARVRVRVRVRARARCDGGLLEELLDAGKSPLYLPYISPTSPLHLGGLLEELLDALEGEVLATQQRQHLAELVRVERALPVDVGKG